MARMESSRLSRTSERLLLDEEAGKRFGRYIIVL